MTLATHGWFAGAVAAGALVGWHAGGALPSTSTVVNAAPAVSSVTPLATSYRAIDRRMNLEWEGPW